MVAKGELGDIRVVQAEYPQDWLTGARAFGSKQAEWRTDSKRRGGGHRRYRNARLQPRCFRHRTGNRCNCWRSSPPSRLAACGRRCPDPVALQGGARGLLWASQVAVGNEMVSSCASTAPRAGSNGRRQTRIIYGSPVSASRSSCSRAPAPERCRKPPAYPACRVDTPRVILKALPRSMPKLRAPSAPRGPGLHPMPERSIRPCVTAWPACASSKLR